MRAWGAAAMVAAALVAALCLPLPHASTLPLTGLTPWRLTLLVCMGLP
jgi:hypothetical protein